MTDYTEHNAKVAAEYWRRRAAGESVESVNNDLRLGGKRWDMQTCDFESPDFDLSQWPFDLKHPTITIGGIEVPRPLEKGPEVGERFYAYISYEGCIMDIRTFMWEGSLKDEKLKNRGIFKNREDAIAYGNALLSIINKPWRELAGEG